MNKDAFELLQAANPLPEDPPPLPIAPLLERVEQLPPQTPPRSRRRQEDARTRPDAELAVQTLGAAVAARRGGDVALTASTTVTPKTDLG